MDELIRTFHIDIKLLLAQMVNFAIVVFVLFKFAYKPLLKHMNDRSNVIQKGLDDAKKAQQQMEQADKMTQEKILQAKQETRSLLQQAQQQAEKNKDGIVNEARSEAEKVVAQAKLQISAQKDKMIQEVKSEIGGLVFDAVEKIMEKKATNIDDQEIIEEAIREIK